MLGREQDDNIRMLRGLPNYVVGVKADHTDVDDLIRLSNQEGTHLWFEYNTSRFAATKGRSSSPNIDRLTALIADIDFKASPEGMQSEQGALELIRDLSAALGTPPSAIVYSGNGMQPYWPIEDGAITPGSQADILAMLQRWGTFVKMKAAALGGGADGVFDLPRVLRVPGSRNVKDPENPKPVTALFREIVETVTLEEIDTMLDDYEIPLVAKESLGTIVSPMVEWEWAAQDCQMVETSYQEIITSLPAARHPWSLKYAAILYGMVRGGCLTEESFYRLRDALADRLKWLAANVEPKRSVSEYEVVSILNWGKGMAEQWSKQKLGEELRMHTHDDILLGMSEPARRQSPEMAIMAASAPPPDAASNQITRLAQARFTDVGNAERLANTLRGRFIWVPALGWHVWDGSRYVLDTLNSIVEEAKDMFTSMLVTATTEAQSKWAKRSLSIGAIRAAVELCKSIPFLAISTFMLDAKPYEISTPGGIVDLWSGSIRQADPLKDFHTMTTGITPDFTKEPTRFLAFLDWAFMGDTELIQYVQRLFGMAAVGKIQWHIFPIFLGAGSNGKTTLLDLIAGVFGMYSATMPQKFLIEQGQQHPTIIAQLRGVRIALSSEVSPTARFDEALVKTLTGESRLRGRFMGENFFDFPNQSTHFLAANHLPSVTVGGKGFWRRIRLIHFRNAVAPGSENADLVQSILSEEAEGILAWVIAGASIALKGGENAPMSVTHSTSEYELEEDSFSRFCVENLIPSQSGHVPRELVYNRYQTWCYRQNINPMPLVKFNREMSAKYPPSVLQGNSVYGDLNLISYDVTPGMVIDPGKVFYGDI